MRFLSFRSLKTFLTTLINLGYRPSNFTMDGLKEIVKGTRSYISTFPAQIEMMGNIFRIMFYNGKGVIVMDLVLECRLYV